MKLTEEKNGEKNPLFFHDKKVLSNINRIKSVFPFYALEYLHVCKSGSDLC